MATGKRYYWIKLKESFMTSDTVDFMMSQPNGANYVVLYQMLCLKTINTDGRLSRTIGEVIIPYDIDKIVRDCKWFSTDTVRVALTLYKKFGLIYEDADGTLVLADHKNLVGTETDYALQKKIQRNNAKQLSIAENSVDNVHSDVLENVHTDIRDKDIRDKEIRDRDKDTGGGGCLSTKYIDIEPPDAEPYKRQPPDPLIIYSQECLSGMNRDSVEEMTSYRDIFTDDMIRKAIDETNANGVRAWAYCRNILRRWEKAGFKSLADVKAAEEKREQGKAQDKGGNSGAGLRNDNRVTYTSLGREV